MKLKFINIFIILMISTAAFATDGRFSTPDSAVTISEKANNCIGAHKKVYWCAWNDIPANGGIADLYNDAYYPTTPDATKILTQLKAPEDYNSLFGAVVKGFIKPSISGNYTFNMTGNEEGYFLLSTGESPTNLQEHCSFPSPTEESNGTIIHDAFPTQTSSTISLIAGNYYYFEMRYRDRYGSDEATVYWKPPSVTGWEVVPNINLYEYTCGTICDLPGTPCDDGNATTTGDVYDGFCNCLGTPNTNLNCVGERSQLRTLIWTGLDGYGLEELYDDPDFPNKPDTLERITKFAGPLVTRDNYGTKTAAFLIAPATGTYTFNVTSDNNSALFLSTNHDPANKTEIAGLEGWTGRSDHDKYPSQTSAPITLTKGQYYYLEMLHHESGGGDHFQVYWRSDKTNPTNWQIIEGLYLFDYTCDITCIPEGTLCDDGDANTKDDAYDANCNCTGIPCQGSACDPPPVYESYGACDATDKHSENPKDSWKSCQTTVNPNAARGTSHWIQYDFGQVYPLNSAHIWNYNVSGQVNQGFKSVVIDYSNDGQNWTQLTTDTWPMATGNTNYSGFDRSYFEGISARYVLITALSNWNNGSCSGFSQIAFSIGTCPDVGMPCDDGNPNTVQDNLNANCECEGVGLPVNDCTVDDLIQGNEVVRAANYDVKFTITSSGTVTNGTKVNYVAGESITLLPGFHAQAGSDFLAVIVTCNSSLEEEKEAVLSKISTASDESLTGVVKEATPIVLATEKEVIEIPVKAALTIMPNPARSWTTFFFDIPYETRASLCIFSPNGQKVTCLSDNYTFSAGNYTKEFPAQQLPKGIYFVVLKTAQEVITKNFVVVD